MRAYHQVDPWYTPPVTRSQTQKKKAQPERLAKLKKELEIELARFKELAQDAPVPKKPGLRRQGGQRRRRRRRSRRRRRR